MYNISEQMGIFDTIELARPVKCPTCNMDINTTQTKVFDPFMYYYVVGDVVKQHIVSGIIEETLFCDKCGHLDDLEFYLIIKYHILIDTVVGSQEEAWERLKSYGKNDLTGIYLDQMRKQDEYKNQLKGMKEGLEESRGTVDNEEKDTVIKLIIELIDKFKFGSRDYKPNKELIKKNKDLIKDLSEGDLYLKHYDLNSDLKKTEAQYTHLVRSLKQYIEYLEKSEEEQVKIRKGKGGLFSFYWSDLTKSLKESEKPSFIIDTLITEAMSAKSGLFF
ncbi:MAG: hypothetical protein ACTSRJ_05715 [Candidatus Hodarchaeales archaeon]